MNQLTVRGFDKELERRLRRTAKERGVSLNQAAPILLREGAGSVASEARLPSSANRSYVAGRRADVFVSCDRPSVASGTVR